MDRYLSTSQVAARLGWTVNALNARIRATDSENSDFPPFPPPDAVLGDRYQGWKDSTIDAYEKELDRSVIIRPHEAAPIINALRAQAEVIRVYGGIIRIYNAPALGQGIGDGAAELLHQCAAILESMVRHAALTDFAFVKRVESPDNSVVEHLTLDVLPITTALIYPPPSAQERATHLRAATASIGEQVEALASAVDSYAGRTLGKKLIEIADDVNQFADNLTDTETLSEPTEPSTTTFTELNEIADTNLNGLDVQAVWSSRVGQAISGLRIPLGFSPERKLVELVIGDRYSGGDGYHGLLAGSERMDVDNLILSSIYSAALRYSPTELSIAYVDPLNEPTLADLQRLPHVSIAAPNLYRDKRLSRRVIAALRGALKARYELFASVSARDHTQYEQIRQRESDPNLPPMPLLWLIANDYALLAQDPAWRELLPFLTETGRGAGIRILLAGKPSVHEALDLGRTLQQHFSYRIALRVNTSEQSRALINTDAARHLRDNRAILASGARDLLTFQVAQLATQERTTTEDTSAQGAAMAGASVLDVLQDKIIQSSYSVPKALWLPPLETPSSVDELVSQWRGKPWDSEYGSINTDESYIPFPVAIEDDPYHASQHAHVLDLTRTSAYIAGAKGMGKTNALLTFVQSGCLTHRPGRVSFMCVGEQLAALAPWPHVMDVVHGDDQPAIEGMVSALEKVVEHRRKALAENHISIEKYRSTRYESPDPDDPLGDTFLVIDNADADLLTLSKDLAQRISKLGTNGPAFAVHVIAAHQQWVYGYQIQIREPSLLELTLDDPTTSRMDTTTAEHLSKLRRPGFGCTTDGHELLVARALDDAASATAIERIREITARATQKTTRRKPSNKH